ncbi:hypothetical protein Pcinc_043455, partial [Petrolisthes cinctipes]
KEGGMKGRSGGRVKERKGGAKKVGRRSGRRVEERRGGEKEVGSEGGKEGRMEGGKK